MSIRVAVVDDQALVRGGFAMVLGHQDDIEVVAEAGTFALILRIGCSLDLTRNNQVSESF